MRVFEAIVAPDFDGRKLETVLRRQMELSPTRIKRVKFRPDGILVDGVRSITSAVVYAGQRITVNLPELEENCLLPTEGPLDIVYEDQWLMVIHKPAGLAVHPGPGHYADTLGNFLTWEFQKRGENPVFRPVNRLDQGTSGLMLTAKSAEAHEKLQGLLHTDAFERIYFALTRTVPQELSGTISAPIAPMPDKLNQYYVNQNGKPAQTDYQVLERREDSALWQLRLHTGRTHQIRVHLASLGCPLLGDTLYGGEAVMERPALHSAQVRLLHPFLHTWMEWKAPLPEDFQALGWREP